MTQDRPTAAELVAAVREFLERDVMAATEGRVAVPHAGRGERARHGRARARRSGPSSTRRSTTRGLALLGHDGARPRRSTGELAAAHPRRRARRPPRRRASTHVRATVREKLAGRRTPRYLVTAEPPDRMRIATWNVNSLKARLPRVEEWLGYADVDVLCLQETKLADKAFPALAFSALGYESVHHGQGQWNGVAILSRVGIDDVDQRLRRRHRRSVRGRRPHARRDVRRRARRERLRAERTRGRHRVLRPQARVARARCTTGSRRRTPRRPAGRRSATSTSRPRTATSGTRRRSSARPT